MAENPVPRMPGLLLAALLVIIAAGPVAPQCSSSLNDFGIVYNGSSVPSFQVSQSNGTCICPGGFVGKFRGDGSSLTNLTAQPEVAAAYSTIAQLQSQVNALQTTVAALNTSTTPVYGRGRFRFCMTPADCPVNSTCVRNACLRVPVSAGLQTYLEAGNPASYQAGAGWFDVSGNNRHFTAPNTVLWTPSSDAAYRGVHFAPFGTWGQMVSPYTTATLGMVNNAFTVQMTLRLDNGAGAFTGVASATGCNTNLCLHITTGAGNTIRFGFYGNDLDTTFSLSANVDYHLTFRYDPAVNGGTQSVYLNGVMMDAGPIAPPHSGTQALNIANAWGNAAMPGRFYNYAVWNRALTDAEILNNAMIYTQDWGMTLPLPTMPRQPVTSGLRCYLDASVPASYGGSGTTWTDLSGVANHATLNTALVTWNSAGYFNLPGTDNQAIILQTPTSLGVYQSSFTMALIFRPTVLNAGGSNCLIGTRAYTGCGTSTCMHIQLAGTNNFIWFNLYGNDCGPTLWPVQPNNDYTVHFVFDKAASTFTTYLGTKVQMSCGGRSQYNSNTQLQLGQLSSGPGVNMFVGRIYSFRVWNRPLSGAEVGQNYRAAYDSGLYRLA